MKKNIFLMRENIFEPIRLCSFTGISVERSWTVADAEGESPAIETTTILNDISSCEAVDKA